MEAETIITPTEISLMLLARQRNEARSKSALYLLSKNHYITTRDNQTLMVYEKGYYHNSAEPTIKENLKGLWCSNLTQQDIGEIVNAHLKPQTYIDRERLNTQTKYTCIKNGVLDLETGELLPHNPDYKFTFQLPITYNPDAQCPGIDQFLLDIVQDPKDAETIIQYFAYCIHREYPTAKIIALLGGGRNGKTTIINILKAFLGEENIRGMSLHQLEHDPFSVSYLFGKHANLNPDVGNKRVLTSGAVKKLTGGDFIDTNVKHKDYIRFKNFAKLIFACNELPSSDDTSYAWMSRWLFLKFPHVFDGSVCPVCHFVHDVDKDLIKKLTTEEELSGLLNRVINSLILLRDNNWDFSLSEYVKGMEHEYARLSDPVCAFVEDLIIEDVNSKVEKDVLYAKYVGFVHDIGGKPIGSNHFTQRIKQFLSNVKESRTGNKKFWVGINIREDSVQENLDLVDNPDGGLSPKTLNEI